jgi:hypothetical protein
MGARQQLPQDQLHIENCTRFCADVEALIAESDKKADERDAANAAAGRKNKTPRIGYVEAVLVIAERRKIEPDLAASYISPEIKQKLALEWESKHRLPKKARLPF